MSKHILLALGGIAALAFAATFPSQELQAPQPLIALPNVGADALIAKPIAPFVQNGIDWLANAQLPHGGWGAGQHALQHIRDPHAVQVDPATTAFAAMALLRAGNTLNTGQYSSHVRKGMEILLTMIENAPQGCNITSITGTQPQTKLGQNIDVAMASQFLTKIRSTIKQDEALAKRIDKAIGVCVQKLEQGQNADGSYAAGGWAPVLQSAMATNALEEVVITGYQVNTSKLDMAKAYQRENIDASSGSVRSGDAAGISLYALASTQRASAKDARKVRDMLDDDESIMMDAVEVVEVKKHLRKRGVSEEEAGMLAEAYVVNRSANEQLQNDDVLNGFGNNGGEEFLSFMMTSESMVSTGTQEWDQWHAKMTNLLSSVQNKDGSWSGQHCITSPVFCTAAVILTMTADRG
ncbi:MAG TPA: prenyltransferase/squalene oxidase repeat-containing protein [Saprospiraceae bacterium]|nr:prenyltransferase/squalene oxidase repeat-containing protein [Saprospiraceae bacterium]